MANVCIYSNEVYGMTECHDAVSLCHGLAIGFKKKSDAHT